MREWCRCFARRNLRISIPPIFSSWPGLAVELALFLALGLLMAALGPYDTYQLPTDIRFAYWSICMVGGGLIGIVIDGALEGRIPDLRLRIGASVAAMTLPVTLLVFTTGLAFGLQEAGWPSFLLLLWQVFVIALPVMGVRALLRKKPKAVVQTVVETRTIVEPPLPDAAIAFRRRLSARRRAARLFAVEAHDHYLRVHTSEGTELLTMRFADAMAELAGVHGLQVHRSWWVAADAIEAVNWRRGGGEARLAGDVAAPVSRTYAPALRELGWS